MVHSTMADQAASAPRMVITSHRKTGYTIPARH